MKGDICLPDVLSFSFHCEQCYSNRVAINLPPKASKYSTVNHIFTWSIRAWRAVLYHHQQKRFDGVLSCRSWVRRLELEDLFIIQSLAMARED